MKISIALCTYNGAQFLQEQLESIALQTRTPDEMIICDDQSKDSTLEILKSFASKASFPVRLFLNERNLGSTKNFEKAIGLCTGDLIFLSDQDDIWYPDKLGKVEKLFLSSPSTAAVFTDAEVVDENLRSLGYTMWQSIGFNKREQNYFTQGKFIEVLLKHNVITGSTMAFRSEFKKLIFPIPEIWTHDGWISLLIAFASDLKMIPESLIKYRQHHTQQLGAGEKVLNIYKKHRITDQLKYLNLSFYNIQLEFTKHMLAYEHLVNSRFPSIKIDATPLLKARVTHYYIRTNLPVSRRKRIPFILKELLNLNYHRYSYGFYSFGVDLLRKNSASSKEII